MERKDKVSKTWEAWHQMSREIDWDQTSKLFQLMGWTWRGEKDAPTGEDLECHAMGLVAMLWSRMDGEQTSTYATSGRITVEAIATEEDVSLKVSLDYLLGRKTV